MTIKRTFAITTLLASIVMVAISGTTQSANAQIFGSNQIPNDADVLLVELLDGSDSISPADFILQKNGLADGLQATYTALQSNPQLNLFGESYIIVIQFSNVAVTECSQEVDTQADLTALITCIEGPAGNTGIVQIGSTTCITCAFDQAVSELANVPQEFLDPVDDRQIIDLVTDGGPFPPIGPNLDTRALALAAEDAAIAAGYDRVVALGVGNADNDFLKLIVDPNPPGLLNPVPLPEDDGFVLTAQTFVQFAAAIERKLIGTIIVCPEGTFLPPGGTPPDDCRPFVGGEFLPTDSTALLIAGMTANMSLIVPIAAGIAGAGAYLIRSRMSKD